MTKLSKFETWKLSVPYGLWICADGREVLFNRKYHPILERLPDGTVRAADPYEWVHWVNQTWFFNDGNTPWWPTATARETLKRINTKLAEWGFKPLPKPPRYRGYSRPPETRINPWVHTIGR